MPLITSRSVPTRSTCALGEDMKVGIATIPYNQPDLLRKLVDTAMEWTDHWIEFHLFRHSRIKDVVLTCDEIVRSYPDHVLYYPYGFNRGVATSWNDALTMMQMSDCDVMILCNDDIYFTEGDIDKIVAAAMEQRQAYAIFCAGYNAYHKTNINCHGMSCFAMQPIAIETIGYYDENFFPAYNEDVDYARRAARSGLVPFIVSDTNIWHRGSAAITDSKELGQQNYITHGLNNEYWKNKWGCPVSEDPTTGYKYPFNNPKFHPYFIGEDQRRAPYPPFNRTDRHVVRV